MNVLSSWASNSIHRSIGFWLLTVSWLNYSVYRIGNLGVMLVYAT